MSSVPLNERRGYALWCVINAVSEDEEGWRHCDNKGKWCRDAAEFESWLADIQDLEESQ